MGSQAPPVTNLNYLGTNVCYVTWSTQFPQLELWWQHHEILVHFSVQKIHQEQCLYAIFCVKCQHITLHFVHIVKLK